MYCIHKKLETTYHISMQCVTWSDITPCNPPKPSAVLRSSCVIRPQWSLNMRKIISSMCPQRDIM
ncbi:hypothetical protein Dimus_038533 [Dionaea muscipula]